MVIFAGGQWRNAGPAPSVRGPDIAHDLPLPQTGVKHAAVLLAPMRDGSLPAPRLPQAPAPHLLACAPAPAPLAQPRRAQHTVGSSGAVSVTLDRLQAGTAVGGCATPNAAAGKRHPCKPSTSERDTTPDPAALTSWIKGARSMHRLHRIVRQHEGIMNHIHVSAMITHVSQLAADDPATAAALSAAAGANITTSLPSPAGAMPSSTLPSTGPTATSNFATSSGPIQEAVLAPGAANASPLAATDAADMRELLTSLLRLLHQKLQHFEPRQLANTAWALGKWPAGVQGRDEALTAVVNAAAGNLALFRAQELVNLLYGYAAAWSNSPSSPEVVRTAGASAASNTVSAIATATAASPAAAAVAGASATMAAARVTPPLPATFLSDHARACASQLPQGRFKMQELSNLLWAWGTLLGSSGGGQGDEGVGSAHASRQAAAASQVYDLRLPYREVLDEQLRLYLGSAGPQELANSVHGLARLQAPPPISWLEAFLLSCRRHLRAAGGSRAGRGAGVAQRPLRGSNGGPGLGAGDSNQPPPTPPASKSRRQQSPALPATAQGEVGPGVRVGFNPQELSNLLWGCSKLRLRLPPAFLDDVASALERCLPYMDLQERVNVLWALTWQVKLVAAEPDRWNACEEDGHTVMEAGRRQGHGGGRGGGAGHPEHAAGQEERVNTDGASVGRAVEGSCQLGLGPGQQGPGAADWPSAAGNQAHWGRAGSQVAETAAAAAPEAYTTSATEASQQAMGANLPYDAGSALSAGSKAAPGRPTGRVPGSCPQAPHVHTSPPEAVSEPVTSGAAADGGASLDMAAATASSADGDVPSQALPGSKQRQGAGPTPLCAQRRPHNEPSTTSGGSGSAEYLRQRRPEPQQPGPRQQVPGRGPGARDPGNGGPGAWPGPAAPRRALGGSSAEQTGHAEQRQQQPAGGSDGAAVGLPMLRHVVLAVLEGLGSANGAAGTRPRPPRCQDVSVSMWSLATLGGVYAGTALQLHQQYQQQQYHPRPDEAYDNPYDSVADGQSAGQPLPLPPLVDASGVQALVQLWWQLLPDMSPQAQANCVWAAARLGLWLPPGLVDGLAAWLRRNAAALAPPEAAAIALGLGALSLRLAPSRSIVTAVQALLEQAYLQSSRYGIWELVQVCYGGTQVTQSLRVLPHATAVNSASEAGGAGSPDGAAAAMLAGMTGSRGGGGNGKPAVRLTLPAATEVRMSLDLEYDDGSSLATDPTAVALAAAVRQLQRRLMPPLDRLLLQLQWSYRQGPEPEPEEVAMTLAVVGLLLRNQVSDARAVELAAWSQDLSRLHVRRILVQQPQNVRRLAPLLYECTATAVAAARAARVRSQAAMERLRVTAPGRSAQSSMDEFLRSGRIAEWRLELQQLRRQELRLLQQQQEELEREQPGVPQPRQLQPQHQEHGPTGSSAQRAAAAGFPYPLDSASARTGGAAAEPPQQQPQMPAQPPPLYSPAAAAAAASIPAPSPPQSPAWAASGLSLKSLQRFWASSRPHLAMLRPSEAAMLLWSFAVLTAQPPEAWWRELLAAVYPHLRAAAAAAAAASTDEAAGGGGGSGGATPPATVSDRTLTLLLWGLGHMRLTPPADWITAALDTVEARTARGGVPAAGGAFDPEAVVGLLCGLAELGWSLPKGWLSRVVRGLAPQLSRMEQGQRGLAYQAVVGLDPGLADRLGYEFCELLTVAGGGGGAVRNSEEASEEGAGQRRALFSRSRGGW